MNHVRTRLDVASLNQDSSTLSARFDTSVKLSDINDVQAKERYQMNDLLLSEKLKTIMNEKIMNNLNVIREVLTVKILRQFQNF